MLSVYSHIILFGVGWIAILFFPLNTVEANLTIYSYIEKRRKGEISLNGIRP
jgi:solute:Na+ symporter, SSS family